MRKLTLLLSLLLVLSACSSEQSSERTFPIDGIIRGRDTGSNALTIEHKAIAGYMEAMTMSFPIRGAQVGDLPADGSAVTGTLHVTDTNYWVSDLKSN